MRQKFDEKFLKYWGLSGAKACKSCRSRQELYNEYVLAKFGVDTAENWPLKVCQSLPEFAKVCQSLPKNAEKFDEHFLKYWGLSGAKACKSCRSRQGLSNAYLLAKSAVDTAENESIKVCLIFTQF